MSKMGELSQVIEELRSCSKTLTGISDTLTDLFSGNESVQEPEPAPAEPALTLEAVRAVLADKSRKGHTDEIRSLLQKHGADKLSQLDPANYKALLSEVEVLKDAT